MERIVRKSRIWSPSWYRCDLFGFSFGPRHKTRRKYRKEVWYWQLIATFTFINHRSLTVKRFEITYLSFLEFLYLIQANEIVNCGKYPTLYRARPEFDVFYVGSSWREPLIHILMLHWGKYSILKLSILTSQRQRRDQVLSQPRAWVTKPDHWISNQKRDLSRLQTETIWCHLDLGQ